MNAAIKSTIKKEYDIDSSREKRKKRKTPFRAKQEKNLKILNSTDSAYITLDEDGCFYQISTTIDEAVSILLNENLAQLFAPQKVGRMSVEAKLKILIRQKVINNILDFSNAPDDVDPSSYNKFIKSAELKEFLEKPDYTKLLIDEKAKDVISPSDVTLFCSENIYEKFKASGDYDAICAKGFKVSAILIKDLENTINYKDNSTIISFTELLYTQEGLFLDESKITKSKIVKLYRELINPLILYEELKIDDTNITGFVYIMDIIQSNSSIRHAFLNIDKQHQLWVSTLKQFINEINIEGALAISKSSINTRNYNPEISAYNEFVKDKVEICRKVIIDYYYNQAFFDTLMKEGLKIADIEKCLHIKYLPVHKWVESDLLFLDDKLWSFDYSSCKSNSTRSLEGMLDHLDSCIRIPQVFIDYLNSKLAMLYKNNPPKIEQPSDSRVLKKEIEKVLLIMASITKTENKIKALKEKLQEQIDIIIK